MAYIDYCWCERCGSKAFYDAILFSEALKADPDLAPVCKEHPVSGMSMQIPFDAGDYAGLCKSCAVTHKLVVAPKEYLEP